MASEKLEETAKAVWKHISKKYAVSFDAENPLPLPKVADLVEELHREANLQITPNKLRESFRYLSRCGVIKRIQRKGTILKKPTPDFLLEQLRGSYIPELHAAAPSADSPDAIRMARALMEGGAAFGATIHRTKEDLLKLDMAIRRLELTRLDARLAKAANQSLVDAWITADKEFHLVLLDAAHNPHLSIFGKLIVDVFAAKKVGAEVLEDKIALEIIREHQEIRDQVVKGVDVNGPDDKILSHAHLAFEKMFRHIIKPKEDPRTFADYIRMMSSTSTSENKSIAKPVKRQKKR